LTILKELITKIDLITVERMSTDKDKPDQENRSSLAYIRLNPLSTPLKLYMYLSNRRWLPFSYLSMISK
jgi:hypothetical protein